MRKEPSDCISADMWVPVFLEMMKDGKVVKIAPHGNSMYPFFISDRDEAELKIPERPWKRGDIALYRRDNGLYVIHRVHHINSKGVYLIGDSQNMVEGPLREEQLLAIAVAFTRKGKWISCEHNKKYKVLSKLWLILIPFRRPLIRAWKTMRRIISK